MTGNSFFSGRKSVRRAQLLGGAAALLIGIAGPAYGQANPPIDPDSKPAAPVADGTVKNEADATAQEETGLREIVVTARRQAENLQKVPVAVTAFDAEALRTKAIRTPTEIQFHAPSVQITGQFGRLSGAFAIRGLSGGVTSYFAEVPGGPTEAAAPFYDIASVQVLNGPQGTQFGRANTAGAVLIEPTKPKFGELSGSAEATSGNLHQAKATAVLNIPVTDTLAFRVAANHTHIDGFTRVIGTNDRLDENNSSSARISMLWKPSSVFTNYTLVDYYAVDQDGPGFVLSAYNPANALFNMPVSITAPNGLTVGTATYGAVCQTAVNNGISPSLNACIDQRLRIAATFKPALAAEVDRVNNGGPNAIRFAQPSLTSDTDESLRKFTIVNQTDVNFGDLGFTTLNLRNIFGYQGATGATGFNADGIGGLIQSSASVSGTASYFGTTSANVINGTIPVYKRGPYLHTLSNEFQVRGSVGERAFDWSVGYYYQNQPQTHDLTGVRNIFRNNFGLLNPSLGYSAAFGFNDGGFIRQQAVFGQGALDIGKVIFGIDGIHLTGGYRKTWDRQEITLRAAVLTLPSGTFVPGAATTTTQNSSGDNRAISLDVQATRNLLLYAATRKGYRPGGLNLQPNAASLPSFNTVYSPETVNDVELGAKFQFRTNGLAGRLNLAVYRDKYDNIQRQFSGVTASGTTATYFVNAAKATLQGIEVQGDLVFGRVELSGNYSYTDAAYDRWISTDPLQIIKVGNPRCLAVSTATTCLIDLTNNPFAAVAKHQGSLTATYTTPIEAGGNLAFSATGYAQSRRYFNDQAQRNIEQFGPGVLNTVSQAPFGRVNLRAEWRNVMNSGVSAALFGNNVFDKVYTLSGISQLHSIGVASKLYAEPRTYGLTLSYKWGR